MTTKLFLDTEFTGLHQNTTLISLALVAETGEEFYAELSDYDQSQVSPWIQEHVIAQLFLDSDSTSIGTLVLKGNTDDVAYALREWLQRFDQVELWSDTYAYDIVLFNQLFGGAFNVPKNIFYIPFDLSTVFLVCGIDPDVNRELFSAVAGWNDSLSKHNALHDARVQRECYRILANAVAKSSQLGQLKLNL